MKKYIYLDYAATTPVDPAVLKEMQPYFSERFSNPGTIYQTGLEIKSKIEEARQTVADFLGADFADEIVFTGGGTASINLALKGVVEAMEDKTGEKGRLVISAIEHHAVTDSAKRMTERGHTVAVLSVDKNGLISLVDLKKTFKRETFLVSIMMANNEIGTIEPIKKIGVLLKKENKQREKKGWNKIYFHTDACQATGALDIKVKELGVDLLTINGSKIYGPKGIGALYIKKGTPIKPLLDGGGQERGLVSGTENVPGIMGLAKAVTLAQKNRIKESERQTKLRDWLINQIKKEIPRVRLNGHPSRRLPNNINISFLDIEGEAILLHLDEAGFAVATGSACTADDLEPSFVILALGLPHEVAHSSIRFTLGKSTTRKELEKLVTTLKKTIKRLRKMSPVKVNEKKVAEAVKKKKRDILIWKGNNKK